MIDDRLIRVHAPTQVGVQVHVNHDGCPAGTDNKRRLYIKNNGVAILAYCHHCNEHRVLKNVGVRQTLGDIKRRLVADTTRLSRELMLPPDCVDKSTPFPDAANAYLNRYAVLNTARGHFNVTYSPSLGRLIFPLYEGGKLVFVAQRAVEGECSGTQPKWLMVEGSTKPLGLYKEPYGVTSSAIVVVEDPISAIKLAGRNGVDAICLYGTSLNDRQFEWLVMEGRNIMVFLDGDEAGMRGSVDVVKRLAPAVGKGVRVQIVGDNQGTNLDPKDYSHLELERIITKWT